MEEDRQQSLCGGCASAHRHSGTVLSRAKAKWTPADRVDQKCRPEWRGGWSGGAARGGRFCCAASGLGCCGGAQGGSLAVGCSARQALSVAVQPIKCRSTAGQPIRCYRRRPAGYRQPNMNHYKRPSATHRCMRLCGPSAAANRSADQVLPQSSAWHASGKRPNPSSTTASSPALEQRCRRLLRAAQPSSSPLRAAQPPSPLRAAQPLKRSLGGPADHALLLGSGSPSQRQFRQRLCRSRHRTRARHRCSCGTAVVMSRPSKLEADRRSWQPSAASRMP